MLKSTTLKSSKSKSKLPCQNTFATSNDGQISSLSSRKKTGPQLTTPISMILSSMLYSTLQWRGRTSRSAPTGRIVPPLLRMSPTTGSPSTDVSSEVSLRLSFPRCSGVGSPLDPLPSTPGATPWCPERGRTPGPGGTWRERRGQEGINGLRNYPIISEFRSSPLIW